MPNPHRHLATRAALTLCVGGLLAGSALADEAPPPAPPAPPAAVGKAPPPPPGARVERRIVVIDHDGDAADDIAGDDIMMGPAGGRREVFIMRGAGPDGPMMPGMGPEGRRMPGRGMEGAGGRGVERMMRMARELGLSPEQRNQLRGLMQAARPKMEDLRGQIRAETRKIRDADPGAKGFDALVASSSKRVGELTAQLVQQRAQMQRQVWQMLTPEQRTKADVMKAGAKKRRDEMAERMERRARELRGTP